MSTIPGIDLIPFLEAELAAVPWINREGLLQPIDVQSVAFPVFSAHRVQVDVLRADILHPIISGNKWFKLKYNLLQAIKEGASELLSFGGAWSNHLHALAYLGQMVGMKTIGVVRGDELTADASGMLQDASAFGMELRFVSRQQFRAYRDAPDVLDSAGRYVIPEGGDNRLGMLGAASMLFQTLVNLDHYSHLVVAVGTGCTFTGLRLAAPDAIRLLGVSALKGRWVESDLTRRMSTVGGQNWCLDSAHHAGGFARTDQHLLSFMREFGDNTGITLEPVYTGKAMLALQDSICNAQIPPDSRVLFIHSGGLQGARGYQSDSESSPPTISE